MKHKNGYRLLVILAVVSLMAGLAFVGQAFANGEQTIIEVVVPGGPVAPGESVCVDIYVTPGEPILGLELDVSFDPSILQATGVTEGDLFAHCTMHPFAPGAIDNTAGTITEISVVGMGCSAVDPGTFATICFTVVGVGVSPIDLGNVQVVDPAGGQIPPERTDIRNGQVTVEGDCLYPTVDTHPDDEIALGENVTIIGSGFAGNTTYDVWIVPYAPGSVVAEGDALAPLGGPGLVSPVGSDGSGSIAAIVWSVPNNPALVGNYYEIVVDDGDGVYNACNDALDAVGLADFGFHIYPEALTITLFSMGIVGLGGFYALRRRRGSEIS